MRDHDRGERVERLDQIDGARLRALDRACDELACTLADERLVLHGAVRGDHRVDDATDATVPRLGDRRDHHLVLGQRARVDERADELRDVVEAGRDAGRGGDVVAGGGLDDPARRPDLRHRRVALVGARCVRVELRRSWLHRHATADLRDACGVPATLDWYGCATFRLTIDDLVVFLDAYIDRAPGAPGTGLTADDVDRADWILVGHSHFDHLWGAERIARNTGATIVGSYESIRVMAEQGVPADAAHAGRGR